MKNYLIYGVLFILLISEAPASTEPSEQHSERESFRVNILIEGLSRPWGMAFLPGGEFLVTERGGRLLLIRGSEVMPVSGTPEAAAVGQGGLLDVALSPSYREDRLVYLSFSESGSGGYGTSAARGRLVGIDGETPRLESLEVIYRAEPRSRGGRHFGSRLLFNGGHLFMTLGDRGTMERSQDTDDPYGSLLRLNPNGSIPPDNPFAPGGSNPGEGAPEIWSYGHRNAQGIALHLETGEIWLHEHGPKGGDELNIISRGANYGWPTVTFGIDYSGAVISGRTHARGITDPVIHWTPSIAPSGMTFYQGKAFPGWYGSIFVGALAGEHLRRLELHWNRVVHQEVLLHKILGRIRDVRSGPDGFIYLLTDAESGRLVRLEPLWEPLPEPEIAP